MTAERSRARAACVTCRQRKVRCSGPSPIGPLDCDSCRQDAIKCDWPIRRRPRKKSNAKVSSAVSRLSPHSVPSSVTTDDPRPASEHVPSPTSWPHTHPTGPLSCHFSPSFAVPDTGPEDSNPAIRSASGVSQLVQATAEPTEGSLGVADLQPARQSLLISYPGGTQLQTLEHPPSEDSCVKVYYNRLSGNTAIHPGVNRISLKLRRKPPDQTGSHPIPAGTSRSHWSQFTFDPRTDLPPVDVWTPLVDLFFVHLAQHFPSLDKVQILSRISDNTMSAFLLNAMCALALRFSPQSGAAAAKVENRFMAKAHSMVVQLLRLPTLDNVMGLLILSWAEFGQNSESGFWQFSGMAVRMSLDLGLHRNLPDLYKDADHFRRARDTFWSVFLTDRLISLSAGRETTIPGDIIDMPLPDVDLAPQLDSGTGSMFCVSKPFRYSVELMEMCGRISDLLNGNRGVVGTFYTSSSSPAALAEALKTHQLSLVQFYDSVPRDMVWSAENFKRHSDLHQAGPFLFFHIWANAMLSLTHHPAILHKPRGSDTPLTARMDHSIELSLAASRNVCEFIALTDLVMHEPLLCTPQITQALYYAGLAFAYQLRASRANLLSLPASGTLGGFGTSTSFHGAGWRETHAAEPPSQHAGAAMDSHSMLSRLARRNLQTIIDALGRIEGLWAGAGYVKNILEQRARGLRHATIDFTSSSDRIETFISLPQSSLPSGALNETSTENDSNANVQLLVENQLDSGSFLNFDPGVNETESWIWQNLLSGSSSQDLWVDPEQIFAPIQQEGDLFPWMPSG